MFKFLDNIMFRHLVSKYERKDDRSARSVTFLGENNTVNRPEDTAKFISTVYNDPFVSIAINRIQNTVCGLELEVGRKVENDKGKIEFEAEPTHPLQLLLDKPNPHNTGLDLKRHYVQSLLLGGEIFTTYEKEGRSEELFLKPADRFKVKLDKSSGDLIGYVYTKPDGKAITYDVNEVIHIYNFDATKPYYGKSLLNALWKFIQLNYYSTETNLAMMLNGGVPAHLALLEHQPTPDQLNMLKASFKAENSKTTDKGKLMFAPDIIKEIKQIQNDFKDMQFTELTKIIREVVFATFGLPPFVGGVMEYANYANALIQDVSYWRNTIIPLTKTLEDGITNKMIPQLYPSIVGSGYCVRFNMDNVEALQADRFERSKVDMLNVRSYKKINEVRAEHNMEPMEGGDQLLTQLQAEISGVGGGGSSDTPGTDAQVTASLPLGAIKSPDGDKSININRIGLTKMTRIGNWKRFDIRLKPKDSKMETIVKRFFREQSNRIIISLEEFTNGGKMRTPLARYAKGTPLDADPIFHIGLENEELLSTTIPEIKSIIRNAAEDFYNDYSIGYGFDATNSEVKKVLAAIQERLVKINGTNAKVLTNILKDSYERGLSVEKTSKAIREEYTAMSKFRSRRIARTEALSGYNAGTQIGYIEAELEMKEWLTSMSSTTRDTHAAADGGTAFVSQPFIQGLSQPMMYPGDPAAPAFEVVNCRCSMMPVL